MLTPEGGAVRFEIPKKGMAFVTTDYVERVPAPEWANPGLRYVMDHVDEPSSNNVAETPFTNEEWFMREPTPIVLKSGWNHVRLTVPKLVGDQWKYDWTATFVPVTLERFPREVAGLEYSAQPRK